MNLLKYNSNLKYSYIFGAFGTILLLKNRPNDALCVLIAKSFTNNDAYFTILNLCKKNNIKIMVDDKIVDTLKDKGNIYVIGVFKKKEYPLSDSNHLVLVDIDEPGIIGTIIRSMRGFNFENLVLINANIDKYDEHLIRSTMGSFFQCNIIEFSSLNDYLKKYPDYKKYNITKIGNDISSINTNEKYSLIFAKNKISSSDLEDIKFDKDIALDNKVNIVLFTLY